MNKEGRKGWEEEIKEVGVSEVGRGDAKLGSNIEFLLGRPVPQQLGHVCLFRLISPPHNSGQNICSCYVSEKSVQG